MEQPIKILAQAGLSKLYRFKNRNLLPILMYHGIVERDLVPFCWHQLAVERFREQMLWVKRHYNVLPLHEALTRLAEKALPPRSLAITFDDGFANNRTVAFPILRELELPAAIFLVTAEIGTNRALWPDRVYLAFARATLSELDASALGLGTLPLTSVEQRRRACAASLNALKGLPGTNKDKRLAGLLHALGYKDSDPGAFRLMGWSDVADLQASGLISFGAHTRHHDILSRLGDEAVLAEVRDSHREVARRVGATSEVFAYPNGRREDFDHRGRAAVTACGMRWALSTIDGINDAGTDPLALRRICIGADTTLQRFKLLVSGAQR